MKLTPKLEKILIELKTISKIYPDENLRDALNLIFEDLEKTIKHECEYYVYINSINKDELKKTLERIKEESAQNELKIVIGDETLTRMEKTSYSYPYDVKWNEYKRG